MKRLFIFVRFIAIALVVFELGSAAFAQGEKTSLGGKQKKRLPNPVLPELEREAVIQRPQNPEERMAWETPYSEGSVIRSTGYALAMWWRSVSPSHRSSIKP